MPLSLFGDRVLDLNAGDTVTITVPGSTSNLGPAMDGLGMSVPLRLVLRIAKGADRNQMPSFPDATANVRSLLSAPAVLAACCTVTADEIPAERGLGGSAALRLATLLANTVLSGDDPSTDDILARAAALEGHPDNVASALLGGCVACCLEWDGSVSWVELGPLEAHLVLAVPSKAVPTELARGILPSQVAHEDARFNVAHATLLAAALARRQYERLDRATQDRIHQPYRLALIPGGAHVLEAARSAGAFCSFLSGSGSTLAALAGGQVAGQVAQAMVRVLEEHGVEAATTVVQLDGQGAEVTCARHDGTSWGWRWATGGDLRPADDQAGASS